MGVAVTVAETVGVRLGLGGRVTTGVEVRSGVSVIVSVAV